MKVFWLPALLISTLAFAEPMDLHPCSAQVLPLEQENELVDAMECLFDAKVIKLTAMSDTWMDMKPEFDGKKVYSVRLYQKETGSVKNVLVDLYTGMPISEDAIDSLKLKGKISNAYTVD